MSMIKVEPELCKSCGLCVKVCPFGLISIGNTINSSGYRVAEQPSNEKCTACRLCAIMCPDSAISVYKG
ncbi:MAG: 4Fe-4S binding protein [Mogibacterium sp.]|nr:4Fe-4S binding protein [Mogibacterium sp.]